jgi:hypothetical protein
MGTDLDSLCYSAAVSFSWETPTAARRRPDNRVAMYRRELAQRAGMFYRLGYPPSRAIARLVANADWDFEIGCGGRPDELSDDAIAEIVKSTYLRRPTR